MFLCSVPVVVKGLTVKKKKRRGRNDKTPAYVLHSVQNKKRGATMCHGWNNATSADGDNKNFKTRATIDVVAHYFWKNVSERPGSFTQIPFE